MSTAITKKKRIRNGHHTYTKKLIEKTTEYLADNDRADKGQLLRNKRALNEKLAKLQELDDEMIDLLTGEDLQEDIINTEIEEVELFKEKIHESIYMIDEALSLLTPNEENNSTTGSIATTSVQQSIQTQRSSQRRARLPELEVKKFSGKIHEWQEFWDSFESAVDGNEDLKDVDKFAYLRGLLEEPAKSAIAGFSLTEANYQEAVEKRQEKRPYKGRI